MRRKLSLISVIFVVLSSGLAFGQGHNCLICAGRQCTSLFGVGGCACTQTITGGCAICGLCSYGTCYQGCLSPTGASEFSGDSEGSKNACSGASVRNPMTADEMALHLWEIGRAACRGSGEI